VRAFRSAIDAHLAQASGPPLRRLDIGRGGELLAEFHADGSQAWMRWNGAELESVDPACDQSLPLSALLAENGSDRPFEVLSYRPARHLVLLDCRRPDPLIVKGFRKKKIEGVAQRYRRASECLKGSGIHAPDVVDVDAESASLVLTRAPGHALRLSSDALDDFQVLGEALAWFQASGGAGESEPFGSQEELGVIGELHTRLARFGIEPPHGWDSLWDRLQEIEPELPPGRTGLCHRDLHDKQFMLHRSHITLLDFDLMCAGDCALDAGNFLAHLVLRRLQGRFGATSRSIAICGKRFLLGLGRNREEGFWERLRYFQSTTFARLALLYMLRPGWAAITGDLARAGHRCLDDLQRVRDHR